MLFQVWAIINTAAINIVVHDAHYNRVCTCVLIVILGMQLLQKELQTDLGRPSH